MSSGITSSLISVWCTEKGSTHLHIEALMSPFKICLISRITLFLSLLFLMFIHFSEKHSASGGGGRAERE